MNQQVNLSVRCRPGNADHHLWNNHGTFWCHFTVHFPDFTKSRLRLSTDTGDVHLARQLRDGLMALFGVRPQPLNSPLLAGTTSLDEHARFVASME